MRLLSKRTDCRSRRLAERQSEADRSSDRRAHDRQHLPLWHLSKNSCRDSSCWKRVVAMSTNATNRRDFLKLGAAAGGTLLVGFRLAAQDLKREGGTFAPNAFIEIDRSGTVTLLLPK